MKFIILLLGFMLVPELSARSSSTPQLGLSMLKSSLIRLQTQTPISVMLNSRFTDQHDESLKKGSVQAILVANEKGFSFTFPSSQLAIINQEKQMLAQVTDPEYQDTDDIAPTTAAANKLKAIALSKTLNMATELELLIKRAKFIPEQSNYLNQENHYVLAFQLPVEMMLRNKKTRKYVDDFSATYLLTTNGAGVPLHSELHYEGSGSAYLVLHIKAYGNKFESYQVVNNRLILSESEYTQGSQSLFGDFERKQTKTLRLFNNLSD